MQFFKKNITKIKGISVKNMLMLPRALTFDILPLWRKKMFHRVYNKVRSMCRNYNYSCRNILLSIYFFQNEIMVDTKYYTTYKNRFAKFVNFIK